MTFDPVLLLRKLNDFSVRYIVIGGIAAVAYGSPSVTFDLDICYERSQENMERLAAMLRDVHARLRGVDADVPFRLEAATIAAGDHFTFVTDGGDFDILGTPAGTNGYADLATASAPADFGGIVVSVAALEDVMRMKRAAGRAKDRAELEILGALRDEIEGQPPV
jgi:hypothetical protein